PRAERMLDRHAHRHRDPPAPRVPCAPRGSVTFGVSHHPRPRGAARRRRHPRRGAAGRLSASRGRRDLMGVRRFRTLLHRRRRGVVVVCAGGVVTTLAVWLVVHSNSAMQASLAGASAGAWAITAVWAAARDGDSAVSRDARRTLCMNMRAWPDVHLFRTPGNT